MTSTAKTAARSKSTTRLASLSLRLDESEAAYVGVDVQKASYHVAVVTDARFVAHWTQPADPGLLIERLRPVQERIAKVVYEAGPVGFGLVRRLRAAGFDADVIAPSKIPASPGAEPKSDRLDGRKLAIFALKGELTSTVPMPATTAAAEPDHPPEQLRL